MNVEDVVTFGVGGLIGYYVMMYMMKTRSIA